MNTSSCVDKYAEIALWVQSNQHFKQNAKDEFLATDLADPWLIAYAMKHNCVMVTHEVSQPNRKIKSRYLNHAFILKSSIFQLYKCLESWEKRFKIRYFCQYLSK